MYSCIYLYNDDRFAHRVNDEPRNTWRRGRDLESEMRNKQRNLELTLQISYKQQLLYLVTDKRLLESTD